MRENITSSQPSCIHCGYGRSPREWATSASDYCGSTGRGSNGSGGNFGVVIGGVRVVFPFSRAEALLADRSAIPRSTKNATATKGTNAVLIFEIVSYNHFHVGFGEWKPHFCQNLTCHGHFPVLRWLKLSSHPHSVATYSYQRTLEKRKLCTWKFQLCECACVRKINFYCMYRSLGTYT